MSGVVVLNPVTATDGYGNPISVERDAAIDANRVLVSAKTRPLPGSDGSGCVENLKYERLDDHDLPKYSSGFDVVHTINGPAIFYKLLFEVDSDHIYVQITIDGTDVFPTGNGFKLEELEDMQLGSGGGSSGYYGSSNSNVPVHNFDIFQYASNRWIWVPPDPLCIGTSLQIKMKSSDSGTNRDLESGIVVWRAL